MPLSRRSFVAGLLASPAAAAYLEAAQSAPPMRIRRIETVYWKTREDAPFWPHWTWVKIDADSGLSGIGETYPRNSNEAAAIHGVADQLIGHDPRDIKRVLGGPLPFVRLSGDRGRLRDARLERH